MDSFKELLPIRYPLHWPNGVPTPLEYPTELISREEFNALKHDVEELKLLLKAAKRYDENTGQRDCEAAEKVDLLKKLAKLVGVDVADVLPT